MRFDVAVTVTLTVAVATSAVATSASTSTSASASALALATLGQAPRLPSYSPLPTIFHPSFSPTTIFLASVTKNFGHNYYTARKTSYFTKICFLIILNVVFVP